MTNFWTSIMLLLQIWDGRIFYPLSPKPTNFWTLSCFFYIFGMGEFFIPSHQNWQIFYPHSCFFYRFQIRISIDQSSYTSVKNSRTFPINQQSCWHFWQRILIKNSNWSIFLHFRNLVSIPTHKFLTLLYKKYLSFLTPLIETNFWRSLDKILRCCVGHYG